MGKNQFFEKIVSGRNIVRYLVHGPLLFAVLLIALGTALVQADDPNKVGLVVVHGDGEVIQQCIEFADNEISGYELLERSGLALEADVGSGLGVAVCGIDNEGCSYPEDDCFCQCQGASCVFWIYWRLIDGDWQFSQLGAANQNLRDGDVDGWIWGQGSRQNGGERPPAVTFEEICGRPSKFATATPAPTGTPAATPTPQPTDIPDPTDTPQPVPTPVIHTFTSDRPAIEAGQSARLSWDLSGADAVYLSYDGHEEGVVSPGSKTVSPTKTTVYTLVARKEDRKTAVELTVTVNSPPTAVTNADPVDRQSEPPTSSAVPTTAALGPVEPVISFRTASPTLPVGACTNLTWAVQNADKIMLDGVEVGREGVREVCPRQTQGYGLKAIFPGGEREAEIRLEVVEAVPAGVETPTPTAAAAQTGPEEATQPAELPAAATQVSQSFSAAPEVRPVQRSGPVTPEKSETEGLSFRARLGIWGGLVGGWCLIAGSAVTMWALFWWFTNRRAKR